MKGNLKRIAVTIVAIVAVASLAFGASKANVIGTVHSVGGNGCQSCHAPHNGSVGAPAPAGTDQLTGKILLWDRAFSNVTFGVYDSPTLDNKAVEIGGLPLANTEARMYSLLCMSCHDGVTSPTIIAAANVHAVGNVANSAGLTNDHPINMAHDPLKDLTGSGLATIANVTSVAGGLKLYGATNTVQCASCHDVHDNTSVPFLRKSNAASALCLTCHL